MIPHSLKNPLEAITKSFYFNLDRFETKKLIILIKWQNFFAARILARSGVNDRDHYGGRVNSQVVQTPELMKRQQVTLSRGLSTISSL